MVVQESWRGLECYFVFMGGGVFFKQKRAYELGAVLVGAEMCIPERGGYCEGVATSLDHIIPRFKSGCSNRNNLVPACCRCNANKASADMETWYKQQDFFSEEKLNRIKTWMKPDEFSLVDFNAYRKAS